MLKPRLEVKCLLAGAVLAAAAFAALKTGAPAKPFDLPLPGGEREVAGELERIAQSLFGVEQHPPAIERFALPHRLGKIPLRPYEIVRVPPGFEQGPAALEIALEQQEIRGIPLGPRTGRIDLLKVRGRRNMPAGVRASPARRQPLRFL